MNLELNGNGGNEKEEEGQPRGLIGSIHTYG